MKTSDLLKTSFGSLVTLTLIIGMMEMTAKSSLKNCEQHQSIGCPTFTCANEGPCGHRPWVCPADLTTCSQQEICIGNCEKNELKHCHD